MVCSTLDWSWMSSECFWSNRDCKESIVSGMTNYGWVIWAWTNKVQNSFYIDNCFTSSHLFWCIGLRNKQYCIFNKQYSKEEYEIEVAKIITHMEETGERWEFFHPSLSPFGYNETVAQEYYPEIGKDKIWELWYQRSEYEAPAPVSSKVIQWKELPKRIEEVEDSILEYAIACEETGRLFRIQPQELQFYRKNNISLPRKHPDQRHLERSALRR